MAKTSLLVTTTDTNGKTAQKTITDINPEVSNEIYQQFVQKLVNLSTDTYVQTYRVDKTNVDTEQSGASTQVTKQSPGLTYEAAETLSTENTRGSVNVKYNGDGDIYYRFDSEGGDVETALTHFEGTDADYDKSYVINAIAVSLEEGQDEPEGLAQGTLRVFVSETATHSAANISINVQ